MIEIAPNPSGPMHIGTLRTYMIARKLAQETSQKLNVRFDNFDCYTINTVLASMNDFVDLTMDVLDIPFDDYCATKYYGEMNGFPEDKCEVDDALLRTYKAFDYVHIDYFPDVPERYIKEDRKIKLTPIKVALLPVPEENAIINEGWSKPFPFEEIHYKVLPFNMIRWRNGTPIGYRATTSDKWVLIDVPHHFVNSTLRGVTTMVRSILSCYIYSFVEKPVSKIFNMPLYNQKLTSTVMMGDKILSKSSLKYGDVGTVKWAVEKYGKVKLLDMINKSIEKEDTELFIDVKDILT